MSRATMDAHSTLTAPALVRVIQSVMLDYLDGAEAVIHVTKPMQQAAYLQGCAALHAAALLQPPPMPPTRLPPPLIDWLQPLPL